MLATIGTQRTQRDATHATHAHDQVRALALKVALSDKYESGQLVLLTGLDSSAVDGRTADLSRKLAADGLRLRVGSQKGPSRVTRHASRPARASHAIRATRTQFGTACERRVVPAPARTLAAHARQRTARERASGQGDKARAGLSDLMSPAFSLDLRARRSRTRTSTRACWLTPHPRERMTTRACCVRARVPARVRARACVHVRAALLLHGGADESELLERAARNIPLVKARDASAVSLHDLLTHTLLVVSLPALEALERRLAVERRHRCARGGSWRVAVAACGWRCGCESVSVSRLSACACVRARCVRY
jgi:hypothetical protein